MTRTTLGSLASYSTPAGLNSAATNFFLRWVDIEATQEYQDNVNGWLDSVTAATAATGKYANNNSDEEYDTMSMLTC